MSVHLYVLQVARLVRNDEPALRRIYTAQLKYKHDMLVADGLRPWRRKRARLDAERCLRESVSAAPDGKESR